MNQSKNIADIALKNLNSGAPLDKVLVAVRETLQKYKLENLYKSVLMQIQQGLEKSGKENTLYIEAPYNLSLENIKKIEKIVREKIVEQNVEKNSQSVQVLDESLLAGWRAVHKGKVYDASAKSHITNLKKAYTK